MYGQYKEKKERATTFWGDPTQPKGEGATRTRSRQSREQGARTGGTVAERTNKGKEQE